MRSGWLRKLVPPPMGSASKLETSADRRDPHLLSASVSHSLLNSPAENGVVEIKPPLPWNETSFPVLFLLDLLHRFAVLRRGRRDGFTGIPFVQSHDHGMGLAGL